MLIKKRAVPKGDKAREYARRGWAVLPVHSVKNGQCSCAKPTCDSPGKHPLGKLVPQGLKDATTSQDTIIKWWRQRPDANVGIATGAASGIVVLDIDPKRGGEESLKKMTEEHAPLPPSLQVKTGGGGRHVFFRHPGQGTHIKNSAGRLGPGLDIRADGGFIVAPPSDHRSGRQYKWRTPPNETRLARLPKWMMERLVHERAPAPDTAGIDDSIPEGRRNSTLTSLAGSMRGKGMSQQAIEAALLVENMRRCRPPLAENEVKRIAASISRYEPVHPASDSLLPRVHSRGDHSAESFHPIGLLELFKEGEKEIPWIFPGYLARGSLTLLAGDPKIGKTTLGYGILAAVATGRRYLDMPTEQGKVLVIAAEEHRRDVMNRLAQYDLGKDADKIKLQFAPLPFNDAVLEKLAGFIRKEGIAFLMIDTLHAWWGVSDENSAGQVLQKGHPLLNVVRQTDVACLSLVHARKSGGEHGKDIRGTTALPGLADIAISMKRTQGHGSQRCLEAQSRYSETEEKLVIYYTDEGYIALGTPGETSFAAKVQVVWDHLDEKTPQKAEMLSSMTHLSRQDVLKCLVKLGTKVTRRGTGHRGDPYTYRKNTILPSSRSERLSSAKRKGAKREVVRMD